jgi:hypothetical protein
MKRNTMLLAWLSLFLFPCLASAKIYTCHSGDEVTYQSEPCPVEERAESTSTSFGFDGWEFGTNISKVKRIEMTRQLGMRPGTSIVFGGYNKQLLNSRPEQRVYSYRTKVMDQTALVSLFFTKTTQDLYQVRVRFSMAQRKIEERKYFYESLHKLLSNKYGKAKKISRDSSQGLIAELVTRSIVGRLFAWGQGTENLVTLGYKKSYQTMASYDLQYISSSLNKQNKKEITYELRQRTKSAVLKDGNKL